MAETLRYGDELLAQFPDNVSELINPVDVRDLVVSQRSGGVQIIEDDPFTVSILNGTPVSINPLLPSADIAGVLWTADGNNRAKPNYSVAIPSLIIPDGYIKFAQVTLSAAVDKVGSGDDTYLFQLDIDGVVQGAGVAITLDTDPGVVTLLANYAVDISNPDLLVGISVTGVGTTDDLDIESFEMMVLDNQLWSAPA